MKQYDYIIAGGGCAGLSLAYYLSQSPLRNKRVLIIEADAKEQNDRTWCFWESQPSAFEDIVFRQWPVLSFVDDEKERLGSLGKMRYKMIRSADFYRKVKNVIGRLPNFEMLRARVTDMGESGAGAYVVANGRRFQASWIFNSLLPEKEALGKSTPHYFLLQHFVGWWVKCEAPVFEPGKGTLMDFRTPQYQSTRFLYVLPLSPYEALVEHTVFSPRKLHPKSYERALESYLSDTLGVGAYTVMEVEQGAIPMTDRPFPAATSAHIINIGTAGGAVKPTTGYAFRNIQRQVQQIVAQLGRTGAPVLPAPTAGRFAFYDTLLLSILQDYGEEGKAIFSALFRKNKLQTILRFLEEKTTLWEEARIFATLPMVPFLRALLWVKLWPALRELLPRWTFPKGRAVPDMAYGMGDGVETNGRGHIQGTTL